MNHRSHVDTPASQLLFMFAALAVLLVAMHGRMGPELADDGAFFLRYAENMVHGEFWAWNLGEAPVWGASAPLFPLAVALAIKLGLAPMTAMVATGLALSSAALSAIGLLLARRFGIVAGGAFVALAAFDSGAMYYAGSGLETPMTFVVLAFALWALLDGRSGWVVGLAAALLMINKLDLVPTGGLLLFAAWVRDRRFPAQAVVVAAVVAALWYGFAWFHFGAPVPNSFLTKLVHQADIPRSIDWRWFGTLVFASGARTWLAASLLLLPLSRHRLAPVVILLVGTLVVQTIAYTIKYPFEPYNWYGMPAVLCLLVLAAIALQGVADRVALLLPRFGAPAKLLVALAVLGVMVHVNAEAERRVTAFNIEFTALYERDRADAGRWVAEHTPESFRVFTMWGNPAYHSQRHVFDGSYLNRPVDHPDLVAAFRPEVLIMQNNPGSTLQAPVFVNHWDRGYTLVKAFDGSSNSGRDYFFAVLVRDDVVDQVSGKDPPRDLMPFVGAQVPGDSFGEVKSVGDRALFVHPGATTPTTFELDVAGYAEATANTRVRIEIASARHVAPDVAARGGATVRATVSAGEEALLERVVSPGDPAVVDVDTGAHPRVSIAIDNHGSPDSDWIIVRVR